MKRGKFTDMTDRIAQLKSYLREDPDDPFLRFALAKEYHTLGDADAALSQYLELRKRHPEYLATYYHLGKLCESLQRSTEAAESYRSGIALARRAGDHHALSELVGALAQISDEDWD